MLSELIVKLLNSTLKISPNIDIKSVEGNSFAIQINGIGEAIAFAVVDSHFVVADYKTADVTVSASLSAFIYMIKTGNITDNENLHINGKLAIAQRFQKILADFNLDWYDFLEQYLPKPIAQKSSNLINLGIDFVRDNKDNTKEKLTNLLDNTLNNSCFLSHDDYSIFKQQLQSVNEKLDALLQNLAIKTNHTNSTESYNKADNINATNED